MTINKFQVYTARTIGGQENIESYFIDREILTSNGASEQVYLVPTGSQSIIVSINPTNAVGKVQYTISSLKEIQNNTAIWEDWIHGEVFTYKDDVLYPITAIRCYKVSGLGQIIFEARIP